jgi:hypothetical protein
VHPTPFLIVVLVCCTVGCLGAAPASSDGFHTIARGAFSGITQPTEQVIKDKAAWEALWAKHAAGAQPAEKLPQIDFPKEMVIFVAMGRKNTGGYKIQITKVEPVGDKLRISVLRSSPPPGAMAIQALTAPFDIVAVAKSDLKPEFIDVNRSMNSGR